MSVELTPNGTRGVKMPSVPRPLAKIMLRAITWFMRLRGVHLLELTTVGSKSGKLHGVTFAYFPAGDQSWLVVASSSGAAKHPAWYFNMARNPDKVWITLDGNKIPVKLESLKGAEREAAWKQIVTEAPNYGEYQVKTDREIPVVRLTAIR